MAPYENLRIGQRGFAVSTRQLGGLRDSLDAMFPLYFSDQMQQKYDRYDMG